MRKCTICYCVKDGNVLLALKKSKIGAGWLNGWGGGVEETDSSIAAAAVRELNEEAHVTAYAEDLEQVAQIEFRFEGKPIIDCHMFIARDWTGEPQETEEMGPPESFPIANLPEERMWKGDRLWLVRVLKGETLKGYIDYSADGSEVLSSEFTPHTF